MVTKYVIQLTDIGFARLRYYIDENIISEFRKISEKSDIDAWINEILTSISYEDIILDKPDIDLIYQNIYYENCNSENYSENFKKALEVIKKNGWVEWIEK